VKEQAAADKVEEKEERIRNNQSSSNQEP